jgi:chloramphenicol 3-O phosphotransferase
VSLAKETNEEAMPGRVIVLNGPSSVGKTSIASAFQESAIEPWLRLGFDSFLDFVPEPLRHVLPSADNGFRWHPAPDEGNEPTRITVGPFGHQVVRGMHRAIAALARSGLDVIVDDVLLEPSWLDDYLVALEGLDVIFVGVNAPLDVIEEREAARGDRFPRQARGHYDIVHYDDLYDVRIDTSVTSATAGARLIAERLAAGPGAAFDELRRRRV